jgi:hypothetical protein
MVDHDMDILFSLRLNPTYLTFRDELTVEQMKVPAEESPELPF